MHLIRFEFKLICFKFESFSNVSGFMLLIRLKLKSIYKKGEIIEEHEFNEKGKEIRTFPEIIKEET
jgi:hypothetical protein